MPEIGATGRGEDMEITTYLEQALTSELQGNLVDICPVGALTSKPYAFAARPWELGKTQSIDVMDARRLGDPGRYPRPRGDAHPAARQRGGERGMDLRQDAPRRRRPAHASGSTGPTSAKTASCAPATWAEAFAAIAAKAGRIDGKRIGAIAGDLAAVEEMFALKELLAQCGSGNLGACRTAMRFDPKAGRASYMFNPTIAGIEQADALLIVGSNPRKEAAVLNARIRKRWRSGQLKIGVIGDQGRSHL